MNFSEMEKSMLHCVSINLSKCDNLIKKRDGPSMDADANDEANNIPQKPADVKAICMKNPSPSKTMSIKDIFNIAITEARNENPKEFCLPAEYLSKTNLYLTIPEKDTDGCINDMDSNDMMDLPARRCYYCKRICSDGEIISCDFCPGSFHINCLSPPLCSIPDVKWMCPLHPQHILDRIMNSSCSLTELTFWWNKVAAPTNDKNVEIDFIEKTKQLRKEQPTKKIVKNCIKVPDIIKYHYEHPSTQASLLQELTDAKRDCYKNKSFSTSHQMTSGVNARNRKRKYECEETNYYQSMKDLTKDSRPRNGTLIEIVNDDNFSDNSNISLYAPEKSKSQACEDFSLWDKENKRFKFTSCGIYDYDRLGTQISKCSTDNSSDRKPISVQESFSASPEKVNGLDSTILSWEKIHQIISRGIQNSSIDEKSIPYGNEIISALKERLFKIKLHSITRNFPPSFSPKTLPYPFSNSLLLEKPLKKTHAVLCPLSHHAPPVFMYHNTLNIGTDIFNDVYLINYGNCDFLSKNHATIFFDEYTKTYELLNYSEYNCVVDGLCYTNNLSAKTRSTYTIQRKNEIEMNSQHYQVNQKVGSKRKITKTDDSVRRRRFVPLSGNNESTDKKRLNSNINPRDRESRFVHRKLLQDIEKLVTKPQKEMNMIADEDLNEISKILRTKKPSSPTSVVDENEHEESPRTVFIIKRKRKLFPTRTVDRTSFFNRNRKNIRKKTIRSLHHIQDNRAAFKISSKARVKLPAVEKVHQYSAMERTNCCETLNLKESETNVVKDGEEVEPVIQSSSNTGFKDNDMDKLINQNLYHCEDVVGTDSLEREEKCKCRTLNLEMPVGHDSSWEVSASLHHGSHIRFGCIEFVFCIVDHPTIFRERSYVREKGSSTLDELSSISLFDEKTTERMKNEDLSSKLTSILSVLSSESEMCDESSSYSLPITINANHEFGSEKFEISKTGSTLESEIVSNEETSSMSSDAFSIFSDLHHTEEIETQGKKNNKD